MGGRGCDCLVLLNTMQDAKFLSAISHLESQVCAPFAELCSRHVSQAVHIATPAAEAKEEVFWFDQSAYAGLLAVCIQLNKRAAR